MTHLARHNPGPGPDGTSPPRSSGVGPPASQEPATTRPSRAASPTAKSRAGRLPETSKTSFRTSGERAAHRVTSCFRRDRSVRSKLQRETAPLPSRFDREQSSKWKPGEQCGEREPENPLSPPPPLARRSGESRRGADSPPFPDRGRGRRAHRRHRRESGAGRPRERRKRSGAARNRRRAHRRPARPPAVRTRGIRPGRPRHTRKETGTRRIRPGCAPSVSSRGRRGSSCPRYADSSDPVLIAETRVRTRASPAAGCGTGPRRTPTRRGPSNQTANRSPATLESATGIRRYARRSGPAGRRRSAVARRKPDRHPGAPTRAIASPPAPAPGQAPAPRPRAGAPR